MTSTCSKENKTNYEKYSFTYLSMCYPCIYQPWKKAKNNKKKIVLWNDPYLDLNQDLLFSSQASYYWETLIQNLKSQFTHYIILLQLLFCFVFQIKSLH